MVKIYQFVSGERSRYEVTQMLDGFPFKSDSSRGFFLGSPQVVFHLTTLASGLLIRDKFIKLSPEFKEIILNC